MERVQAALHQQLTESAERVSLELREKDEELRRAKTGREDVGVQLYGVQQQLAKLQMELEERHNEFNAVAASRVKAEEDAQNAQQTFKETRSEIASQREKLHKNQSEADALNATLRQVEQYNEEMKSEIAVTRRATYKAEETVSDLEKKKEGQDMYVSTRTPKCRRHAVPRAGRGGWAPLHCDRVSRFASGSLRTGTSTP